MPLDEVMEQVATTIGEVLADCLQNREFEAPLHVIAVASNGTAQIYRCERSEVAGGLQMTLLSEHNDGSGFQIPINFFVSDRTGRAARLLLETDGKPELEILP